MTRTDIINAAFLASAAGWENVDGSLLVKLLVIITAVATLATMVMGWFKKNPPDNEKYRQVKDCEHLCQSNVTAHEKLDAEMNGRLKDMNEHSAKSREKLHLRLAQVESNLAALTKENEIQTQHIYSLEQKIDRFIERHQ